MGSSPAGARYRFTDSDVANGTTYWYELEDIETTGATTRHGPVFAIPGVQPPSSENDAPNVPSSAWITYGDPAKNALQVLSRGRDQVVIELATEGFHAEPLEDGSVRIVIPGFEYVGVAGAPAIPVERRWVDAVAGRKVELVSVRARSVEAFDGLRPASTSVPELVADRHGNVKASSRRARTRFNRPGLYPREPARIAEVAFQQERKKALVELAPLRWDPSSGQLLLSKRLTVRIAFKGREPSESTVDGLRGRR